MTEARIPPSSLVVEYDVPARMRDGVLLRCDIARPAAEGRWPVILVRSPYSKDRLPLGAIQIITLLARQGFVAIIQDTRGRFTSDGNPEFMPFTGDFDDGEDTIAWAASLPYSTGEVCGYGTSYHGYTQWASAVRQPPALKAIVPFMSPAMPRRTLFWRGGVCELESMASWFCFIGFETLRRRHLDDPAAFQAAAATLVAGFEELMRGDFTSLPLNQFAALRDGGVGEHFFGLLAAQDGDSPIVRSLEQTQAFEKVTVPAMLVGGWYDMFSHGTIDQFVGMRARAGSERARQRTRLVMGPWGHSTGLRHMVGERNFGMASAMSYFSLDSEIGEAAKFMRTQLDDTDDQGAPVRIFVMGANVWRDEQEWPIARTEVKPLYLSSSSHADEDGADGRLLSAPGNSPPDSYRYDPADPVPTWGGNALGMTTMAGPRDQRVLEQRSDVLVYTTEVLAEDLEVTGTPFAELWVSIDCVDTDFVVRLVDVFPDGTAYNVTEGILRARYRSDPDSFGPGEPMEPGRDYLVRVELSPTSNVFKAGHRIRLQVTSSNFPRWARNLNVWDQFGATLAEAKTVQVSVLHDESRPSRILLPTIPAR
jgi:putative CocE/NonD family hydrolase